MAGGRPRLAVGTYGDISVRSTASAGYQADTRFRDWDGKTRRVTANGHSKAEAKANLKDKLLHRDASADNGRPLTADSTFTKLAELWLEDVDLRTDLAPGSKDVYRRELHSLLMPTFADFALREITIARVDRFLKLQATTSYSYSKHSRTLLNLMFSFALRIEAIPQNPVAGTIPLRNPKPKPKSLTLEQIASIRAAAERRHIQKPLHGPTPSSRMHDLVEVMLGTATRIGETLALRKCDVDLDAEIPTVTIAGTIVQTKGVAIHRQPKPKNDSSIRTVAIPAFAVNVLRRLLDAVADAPDDHLLFFTRNGTPFGPYNARRDFRAILADAGLQEADITPHSFRRTGATVISRGSDEEHAAAFLGHGSSATTRRYYIEEEKADIDQTAARTLEQLAPKPTPIDGSGRRLDQVSRSEELQGARANPPHRIRSTRTRLRAL